MLNYSEKDLRPAKGIKVYIEGQEIKGLLLEDFHFVEDLEDFGADLVFWLSKDSTYKIEPYMDLKISIGGSPYAGGIITKVEYIDPYFNTTSKLIKVEVSGYKKILQGRNIKLTLEMMDNYKCVGDIVRGFTDQWLISEGITKGRIDDGALIEDVENLEGFDAISLYDLMEYFCEISSYLWFITKDKKLNFYSVSQRIGTDWGDKEAIYQITEDNQKFFNIENIVMDYGGYANKVFVIGGENEDDNIKEENLTLDDYTYVKCENTKEQQRLKGLSNRSGVVGVVLNKPEIKTVKQLQAVAEKELADRSSKPLEINISTSNYVYQVGDYVYVGLPKYGISETLCITKMELSSLALKVPYKLTLQNKSQYLMGRLNAYNFFGKINRALNRRQKNLLKVTDPYKGLTKGADLWFVDYRKFKLTNEKDDWGNRIAKDDKGNKLLGDTTLGEACYWTIENPKFDNKGIERPKLNHLIPWSSFDVLARQGAPVSTRYSSMNIEYNGAFSGADVIQFRIENIVGFEWLLFVELDQYKKALEQTAGNKFYILLNGVEISEIKSGTFNKTGKNTLMVLYTENNIITDFTKKEVKTSDNWNLSGSLRNNEYIRKAYYGDTYDNANESIIFIEKHFKYIPGVPKSKEQALEALNPIYKKLQAEV